MVRVPICCTLHIKLSYAHITLRFSIHDDDPHYTIYMLTYHVLRLSGLYTAGLGSRLECSCDSSWCKINYKALQLTRHHHHHHNHQM